MLRSSYAKLVCVCLWLFSFVELPQSFQYNCISIKYKMKRSVKVAIRQGVYFFLLLSLFHLFELEEITTKSILKVIVSSLIGCTFMVVFYWLYLKNFMDSEEIYHPTIKLEKGEEIQYQTLANRLLGITLVTGKLFLTNKRLLFVPSPGNYERLYVAFNLEDIIHGGTFRTFFFFNNGLAITSAMVSEKFRVENLQEWVNRLK